MDAVDKCLAVDIRFLSTDSASFTMKKISLDARSPPLPFLIVEAAARKLQSEIIFEAFIERDS